MAVSYTHLYWLVGNSKNLPIIDHSLDFITALFTVVNLDELKRTLKPGGYVIHVTANPNHLIEIKHLIYDEIKVKSDKYIRLDLEKVESYDLVQQIKIDNREDALNLLKMCIRDRANTASSYPRRNWPSNNFSCHSFLLNFWW